jgi:hypothetical protein
MATHLEETVKAFGKCMDEAKKLEKQFNSAKTPQDKEKLAKMAEACKKMALGYANMVEGSKQKDLKEMGSILHKVNPAINF